MVHFSIKYSNRPETKTGTNRCLSDHSTPYAMQMKKFVSKALEVNLAVTRTKIEIPLEHQWFLSLSVSHFGINKRAGELLNEYHHP